MDPISAIGIAAASAQLAGVAGQGLLLGIGFLKGLKKAPTRLSAVLNDIEVSTARIIHLQETLDDDMSGLSTTLSEYQLSVLRRAVDDACGATAELQALLEPLFGGPTNSGTGARASARMLWKEVVSLKVERDIEEKLEKIGRRNDEVLRELQLSGLDIQTRIL